jgi:UDP-N-acetylmuramoyl-tripeptide--D-alanyl-D-alanine ligase
VATPLPPNRARFSLRELREITAGSWLGSPPDERAEIVGVSTDTRELRPDQAFVAIAGERHDGHGLLDRAAEAGATLGLVERAVEPAGGRSLPLLRVASTVDALGALGARHLARWRGLGGERRVVGITGSAGKTTTRRLVATLLAAQAPAEVLATRGNLNNLIGVPMMAFSLEAHHRLAVLELGTSRPGEIATLAALVEPDVGLVTLVAAAHGEGLGDIEQVAHEKSALFRQLRPAGIAIGNGDDARVAAGLANGPALRRIRYGFGAGHDYRIVERRLTSTASSQVVLARRDGSRLDVALPLLGRAGALGFAAAVAVCESLLGAALPEEQVRAALAAWSDEEGAGRLRPRTLPDGLVLIDDSYNSNPASCRASLEAAAEVAAHLGRELVLVLGEMRELGAVAEPEHRAVGRYAATLGARALIAVGGLAELVAREAQQAGLAARFVSDAREGARLALVEVRPGDVVLVKGSRGVRTEQVAHALVEAHGGAMPRVEAEAQPRASGGQAA